MILNIPPALSPFHFKKPLHDFCLIGRKGKAEYSSRTFSRVQHLSLMGKAPDRVLFLSAIVWLILSLTVQSTPLYSQAGSKLTWDFSVPRRHFTFLWDPPSSYLLTELRERYNLEALITLCQSDLERVQIVCHWVHQRWSHSNRTPPSTSDPLLILRKAEEGVQFSCWEYSLVAAAALTSLGIKARVVDLLSERVDKVSSGENHVVVEAFLNDLRKWVMVDPQWDVVAQLKGVPLNCVEFRTVMERGVKGVSLKPMADNLISHYWEWVKPYLYFIGTFTDQRLNRPHLINRRGHYILLVPKGVQAPKTIQGRILPKLVPTTFIAEFYPSLPNEQTNE